MASKVNQTLRHRDVQRARAIGIDNRIAPRFGLKRVIGKTAEIADHFETIHGLSRPARENERKLICVSHLRFGREVMAQMDRYILRFDLWRNHMEDVKV